MHNLFISVHMHTHTLPHSMCPQYDAQLQITLTVEQRAPKAGVPLAPHRLWADRAWGWLLPSPGFHRQGGIQNSGLPQPGGDVVSRGLGLRETLGSRSGPHSRCSPLQQKCAWEINDEQAMQLVYGKEILKLREWFRKQLKNDLNLQWGCQSQMQQW